MPQTGIERELMELERRYWKAIQDRDVKAALELTDDPCIVAGAAGVGSINRQSFTRIMEGAKYTLNDFELDGDAKVRMIGDDVAVLAYKVHEDLTVNGEQVGLDAADSSVWVKKNGSWVCALHTESLIGDAYGRDRIRKPGSF